MDLARQSSASAMLDSVCCTPPCAPLRRTTTPPPLITQVARHNMVALISQNMVAPHRPVIPHP
jgi:hypothetical protein